MKLEVQKSERMQLELNDRAAPLNPIILKQSDQIQKVSGFEFGPLVEAASGKKSTKKSFEGCCCQGDRYTDKQRLKQSFNQVIANQQEIINE